jgi:hypothetical protein
VISLVVVILVEFVASSLDVGSCFKAFEIEFVEFDGSEKPLNDHIVNGSSFSVHGDLDDMRFQEHNVLI